jgi:hypothetical protein
MYRASHDTFASTIERLEAELRELRALRAPARPRERYLWTVTVASVLGMVLAIGACVAARARTEDAERRFDGARVRLEVKTQDLGACETLASRAMHVAVQY